MKHLLMIAVCFLFLAGFAAGQTGSYSVVTQAQCAVVPSGVCSPAINLLIYPNDPQVVAYRFTVTFWSRGSLDSVTVFSDVRYISLSQRIAWATIPTQQYGDIAVVSALAQPLTRVGDASAMVQQ